MLRVYDVMIGVLERLGPVIGMIEKRDADLARQARRAASSVVLNIAEGSGSSAGNRSLRYRNALGSARETKACLDVAKALYGLEVDPVTIDQLDKVAFTLRRVLA